MVVYVICPLGWRFIVFLILGMVHQMLAIFLKIVFWLFVENKGKISVQPHITLCIQFLNRENNDKNNTLPLGKQICFTIVWGCAEILPK